MVAIPECTRVVQRVDSISVKLLLNIVIEIEVQVNMIGCELRIFKTE